MWEGGGKQTVREAGGAGGVAWERGAHEVGSPRGSRCNTQRDPFNRPCPHPSHQPRHTRTPTHTHHHGPPLQPCLQPLPPGPEPSTPQPTRPSHQGQGTAVTAWSTTAQHQHRTVYGATALPAPADLREPLNKCRGRSAKKGWSNASRALMRLAGSYCNIF